MVVIELSSFKNHQTKRFKELMKVRPKVKRIVGFTGTPSSNGLMDLFTEFRLLDIGEQLGIFIDQYRTVYLHPDKRNGQIIFSYKPLTGAEKKIYDKISDITISMKSTDHLQMPKLISIGYEVQLSDKERDKYDNLKSDLVLELTDGEIIAANAASLSGKLSQMANGAIYDDKQEVIEIHSRNLDALEDIIKCVNGRTLLVAYWFSHDLDMIFKSLESLHIPFSKLDTTVSIRRWNSEKLPVALIHPAIGMTLTEYSKCRFVACLVRAYLEPGTVSTDSGKVVAAGAGIGNRGGAAYHHKRHY